MSPTVTVPSRGRRLLRRLRPRMLTGKLALLFFAITAAAFSVIYFYGVAQLESNLENQKQRDLRRVAGASSQTLEDVMGREIPSVQLDKLVRSVADSGDARVTLLGVQRSGPTGPPQGLQFFAISDSTAERRVDINPGLAARAVRTGRITAATTGVPGAEVSQVAQPLYFRGRADWVALYSRSLDDVAESVALIRRQILAATAVALLVALLGGYLVARALARRVRRIEAGAKQVAAGHYIDPLPVTSEDELGQLSRTFNEMQEQLARVDRARKEFIATASHELRTPIFSLAGFVELLQDEELDEPTRDEFLQTMHEQVERLQKLAVDLLDLSRLDTGSVQISHDDVNLSALATKIVAEFTPAVARHQTELDMNLPEDGVEARCDRERVAQIMRILLDNALRHTPEGTHVTVSAERHNGAAEFTVADAGPGLDSDAAAHAFDRFYTADVARGAGLGLAIARELAERMDGAIRLSSQVGGTEFTLELPVVSDDGAPADDRSASRPEPAPTA